MAILVTGGAGYIGSHTVRALCKKGYNTIVIDNLSTGYAAAIDPAARFCQGDIRDEQFLSEVFAREQIDCVIHFAAKSLVSESMKDPLVYYDNNVYGTQVLLRIMCAAGVNKIVFSSTAAVYGEPPSVPISEDAPACPTNAYGETKLAMEKMFRWADHAYGLRYTSLRYFNACGADASGDIGEAHRPETHLIPLVLQAATGQRPHISVFGTDYPTRDGTCVRDYIHVADLATAHILAMERLLGGAASNIFNLGNGVGFTVKEVIEAARAVTGLPIAIRQELRRAGDPAQLVASSAKAANILGWQPRHTALSEIISSAWLWHSTHPEGHSQDQDAAT